MLETDYRIREIKLADFGFYLQVDDAARQHDRTKLELNTEFLAFDGHSVPQSAVVRCDGNGKFSAGKKPRLVSRQSDKVGLRQRAHNPLLFKGCYQNVK